MAASSKSVLVLHGYAQNATIFSKRLGALRKACGKDVDFFFLDGPLVLQPADMPGDPKELGSEASTNTDDPALTPRGWYKAGQGVKSALAIEESLALVKKTLKEKHYDGIFGFSQGACMAAFIAALLEHPERYPDWVEDGKPIHPPFQFCIAAAGFKINDPLAPVIFGDSYSTPTLHIIGATDIIVTEERAQSLLDVSANKRVERHDGGHFIPSKANWRKFLAAYLKDPLGNVPPPAPSSTAPTPSASGTATPTTGAD
ncbi:FSH1-domain-containing protein [Cylindrobasidium torrendii FP15055 ss-10]|uniref:FSH1-domain-containing protein n=1 Tax=Cylindrobasidium torrendii FP15055 ss-10 TaxID=1314674 RepID=A0A0D7AUP7_9AGAR|nr:FSH1-domain-containing protein [Cylindrobasidium torrendii FP15055 ss-10]